MRRIHLDTDIGGDTDDLCAHAKLGGRAYRGATALGARSKDGVLGFPESPSGKPTRVVAGVDGPRLEREWVAAVGSAG